MTLIVRVVAMITVQHFFVQEIYLKRKALIKTTALNDSPFYSLLQELCFQELSRILFIIGQGRTSQTISLKPHHFRDFVGKLRAVAIELRTPLVDETLSQLSNNQMEGGHH